MLEQQLASRAQGAGIRRKDELLQMIFDVDNESFGSKDRKISNAVPIRPSLCNRLWGGPTMPASGQNLWSTYSISSLKMIHIMMSFLQNSQDLAGKFLRRRYHRAWHQPSLQGVQRPHPPPLLARVTSCLLADTNRKSRSIA